MEGTYMKSEQKEIKVDNFKSPLERRIDAAIKESDRILASNPKWVSEKEFWDRMEKVKCTRYFLLKKPLGNLLTLNRISNTFYLIIKRQLTLTLYYEKNSNY